jgi:5-dehydro-2-deoxygluconokinase
LYKAAGTGLWIGRPVELPGSRPLAIEPEIGTDLGGLGEWPLEHVVKVLCYCHPGDDTALQMAQEETVQRLFSAARRNRLEFLLEIIPSKVGPVDDQTNAKLIQRFYDIGIHPDWWKLEPMTSDAGWKAACDAITANDPHCRGIVVLGLDAQMPALEASLTAAARHTLVRGFAIGRTIFAHAAAKWLAGKATDEEAVAEMAGNYARLCDIWERARGGKETRA